MSWRTSFPVMIAREVGRKLGVNRLLAGFILGEEYEAKYDQELAKQILAGDCVWDVGANVGYYTQRFAERVGPEGNVFSFEPSPQNFQRLQSECESLSNVRLLNMALGSDDSTLGFEQGEDDLGATSRLVEGGGPGVTVEVRAGTSVIADGLAEPPNIMKIDVEGFEFEVITGLGEQIRRPSLRALGIEVHFRILKERGNPNAPARIEQYLRDAGFSLSWADPSHILAIRTGDAAHSN